MTGRGQLGEGRPGIWLDEAGTDPSWAAPDPFPASEPPPPSPAGAPRRRLPPGVGYLAAALVVALVICGIWAGGGFHKRRDLVRERATGQTITTGPYEFRFTEVTAQQKTDYSTKKPYWELTVLGEGRTTGDVSIRPDYIESDTGMFVSKDPVSGEIEVPTDDRIGPADGDARTDFTPGLPLTPYTVSFRYSEGYRPGATLLFAAADLVYGPHFLTDDQEEWHNATYSQRFDLPVRVLPPETD